MSPSADARSARCLLCYNSIPESAYICTECESWQVFRKRQLALALKVVLVVFAPLMAWLIAEIYQGEQSTRSTVDAHITHVTDQIAELVDMGKDFQASSDSLLTNCSKDGQQAANLCLAEFDRRVLKVNELVARLSWRTGLLPVAEGIDKEQRGWQTLWWQNVSWALQKSLRTMAEDGRLLKCQSLDFATSECGAEINHILNPFRERTTTLMCVFTVALHQHLSGLYLLLPRSRERVQLLEGIKWQEESSFCGQRTVVHPAQ